jgi:hypothetical protein
VEPEQKARQEIDRQLAAASGLVQDHKAMNLGAGPGIAVREFPLDTGPEDYLLHAGGMVIGVFEAKPEGIRSRAWKSRAASMRSACPPICPPWIVEDHRRRGRHRGHFGEEICEGERLLFPLGQNLVRLVGRHHFSAA